MGEQTDGRPAERAQRFTDRGERFGRRRFLKRTGIGAVAVGTGVILTATGCRFDDGPYQGAGTGQSSTSGQNATPDGKSTAGQSSGGSQSGASS